MDETTVSIIIVASAVVFFTVDALAGTLKKKGTFTLNEMGVNVLSFCNFLAIRSGIIALWSWVFFVVLSDYSGSLKNFSFWLVFPTYVLLEEYIHYWIHRWSHSIPWLWRIHKPHHVPTTLNLTAAYRENMLWFALLPNAWMTAGLIWAGQAEAAFIATAWKGSSEFFVHHGTRWDLWLYQHRLTRPIMAVLEKIVTLQDTHHAHHGIGRYGHGMCNFGSFLFLFDVLHGTAEFPRRAQDGFGVPTGVKVEPWYEQLWWPLLKSPQAADLRPPTTDESRGLRVFNDKNGRFSIVM